MHWRTARLAPGFCSREVVMSVSAALCVHRNVHPCAPWPVHCGCALWWPHTSAAFQYWKSLLLHLDSVMLTALSIILTSYLGIGGSAWAPKSEAQVQTLMKLCRVHNEDMLIYVRHCESMEHLPNANFLAPDTVSGIQSALNNSWKSEPRISM